MSKTTKRRKGDPATIGSACGSWVPAGKTRAASPWRIRTPKRDWFGPVTVTKVSG